MSKQYEVRITAQAREHLALIRDYIARELLEPEIARRLLLLLRREMNSLKEMPQRIKLIDEMPWHDMGFRRIIVKNYYIYFWINEERKEVQIIAVIYAKREQARQLDSLDIKTNNTDEI